MIYLNAFETLLISKLIHMYVNMYKQSISPGAVKTEIFKPELLELLENIPFLEAEDVSEAVMFALATRPHVQVRFYFFFKSSVFIGMLNYHLII